MSAHVSTEKTDSEWMGLVDSSPILSQKTKTSYKKQLRGVISKFGVSGPVALSYVMMHPDATVVVNAMKAIPDTSLRTYVAAILSLLREAKRPICLVGRRRISLTHIVSGQKSFRHLRRSIRPALTTMNLVRRRWNRTQRFRTGKMRSLNLTTKILTARRRFYLPSMLLFYRLCVAVIFLQ